MVCAKPASALSSPSANSNIKRGESRVFCCLVDDFFAAFLSRELHKTSLELVGCGTMPRFASGGKFSFVQLLDTGQILCLCWRKEPSVTADEIVKIITILEHKP